MEQNEGMKKSTIWIIVGILVLVLLGTWGWVKFHDTGAVVPEVKGEETENIPDITAKHQFKAGKHIVAGEVNLPTPCYLLDTSAVVAESMPEQVTLKFTATTQGDMCAQVVTTERFRIDFTASEGAVIKATWNGKPAKLNLIPVGPNEDLTNFEIFLKG